MGAKCGGADSLLRLRGEISAQVFDIEKRKMPPKSGGASSPSCPYYATPLLKMSFSAP